MCSIDCLAAKISLTRLWGGQAESAEAGLCHHAGCTALAIYQCKNVLDAILRLQHAVSEAYCWGPALLQECLHAAKYAAINAGLSHASRMAADVAA